MLKDYFIFNTQTKGFCKVVYNFEEETFALGLKILLKIIYGLSVLNKRILQQKFKFLEFFFYAFMFLGKTLRETRLCGYRTL